MKMEICISAPTGICCLFLKLKKNILLDYTGINSVIIT